MKKKEYIYNLNRLLQNDKITDSYLKGSEELKWDQYDLEPVKGRENINLRALESKINGIKSRAVKKKTSPASCDAEIALEIHKTLHLTKREACDSTIWNFMNCIFGKNYVAWRWKINKEQTELTTGQRNRFIGNRRRNTFGRLWWIAELTRALGDDYTRKLLSVQDLAVSVYEREFALLKNVLKAYLDTIFDDKKMKISEATNRELAKQLRKAGATVVLDSLKYEDAKDLINRLLTKIKALE